MISFRINIPNRPHYTHDVEIFVDSSTTSNHDGRSPDRFGADYVMQLVQGEIILFKWDGSDLHAERDPVGALT